VRDTREGGLEATRLKEKTDKQERVGGEKGASFDHACFDHACFDDGCNP